MSRQTLARAGLGRSAPARQLCRGCAAGPTWYRLQNQIRSFSVVNLRESLSTRHDHTVPEDRSRVTRPIIYRHYSIASQPPWTKAYLALGSNQGQRLQLVEEACWTLYKHKSIRLLRTSLLYETAAMYVVDQEPFLNATCEIKTCLSPMQLLDALQTIERDMGRVKTIDKGPRNIDLDILLYGEEKVDTERLTVPHKLMHEREFVLRPLADLIPDKPITKLDTSKRIKDYLADIMPSDPPLSPIVPFGPNQFLRPLDKSRKTRVMSILNLTPDSFSDGGRFVSHVTNKDQADSSALTGTTNDGVASLVGGNVMTAHDTILHNDYYRQLFRAITAAVADGGDIIDIGGQSSRPGAVSITAEQECDRIRPAMVTRALFFPSIATSVDTYRAEVAGATPQYGFSFPPTAKTEQPHIEPGAHIVNDISAGLLDNEILSTVARQRQTIILMHMRGTPETMNNLCEYTDGVVRGVAEELKQRVAEAEAAGIPKWRIVLDPGIGFAKTAKQNWELLSRLNDLREWDGLKGMPWLVGTSRKRFIGEALSEDDEIVEERRKQLATEVGLTGTRASVDAQDMSNSVSALSSSEQDARETQELRDGDAVSFAGDGGSVLEEEWDAIMTGARRKTRIGERKKPNEPKVRHVDSRDIGTAATVAAAVQGGADVVRVHETRIARDVIAVADAIWRGP